MKRLFLNNHRGVSLVEVVFASLILGMVALFISGHASNLGFMKEKLVKISESTQSGSMGARFPIMVEFADVSHFFTHLPIGVICSSERAPCLRSLKPYDTEFVDAGSAFINKSNVSHIEFYRDEQGEIKNDLKVFTSDPDADVFYSGTPAIDLSEQKSDVYLTWPLVDQNSPSFPILHQVGISLYFKMDGELGTSTPPSDYAVMRGFGSIANQTQIASALKGQLVVLFNSNDHHHFSVAKVSDAFSCKINLLACQKSVGTGYALQANHYAIKLADISDSELEGLIPTKDLFGGITTSSWRVSKKFDFFPTGFITLHEDGNLDFSGLVDVRKWTHFYHSQNLRGEVLLMPFFLSSYKLEKSKNAKGKKYNLVKTTFKPGKRIKEEELVGIDGPVIFARKLGTKTMSLFVGGE